MDKLECVVKSIAKNFGENIVAIDMRMVSPLFDTFVICEADNPRLLRALKENLEEDMEKAGYVASRVEGGRDSAWILLDYNDIIVHLFSPEERKKYQLEKLWGDQHQIDISAYVQS